MAGRRRGRAGRPPAVRALRVAIETWVATDGDTDPDAALADLLEIAFRRLSVGFDA